MDGNKSNSDNNTDNSLKKRAKRHAREMFSQVQTTPTKAKVKVDDIMPYLQQDRIGSALEKSPDSGGLRTPQKTRGKSLTPRKSEKPVNSSTPLPKRGKNIPTSSTKADDSDIFGEQGASSSSDWSDVEAEDELDLDRSLDRKAKNSNLSQRNVKSIIHHLLTNEHVIKLYKDVLGAQDGHQSQKSPEKAATMGSLDSFPTMTRSKIKDFMEKSKIPTSPCKKSKPGPSILEVDFAEEEDDDEYSPEKDETNETDDDESVISSFLSEFGSPCPVTPSTPVPHLHPEKPALSLSPSSISSPIASASKPLKIDLSVCEGLSETEDEDTIALRTRSKRSLMDTSLNDIEQAFIAPDITPDMYDTCYEDNDWTDFLNSLYKTNTADESTVDDEANDPEFNYIAEAEEEALDDEDFRFDKPTKVSKKELNTLIEELHTLFEDEVLPLQVVAEASSMQDPISKLVSPGKFQPSSQTISPYIMPSGNQSNLVVNNSGFLQTTSPCVIPPASLTNPVGINNSGFKQTSCQYIIPSGSQTNTIVPDCGFPQTSSSPYIIPSGSRTNPVVPDCGFPQTSSSPYIIPSGNQTNTVVPDCGFPQTSSSPYIIPSGNQTNTVVPNCGFPQTSSSQYIIPSGNQTNLVVLNSGFQQTNRPYIILSGNQTHPVVPDSSFPQTSHPNIVPSHSQTNPVVLDSGFKVPDVPSHNPPLGEDTVSNRSNRSQCSVQHHQRLIIEDNMRKHIQLLAQTFILSKAEYHTDENKISTAAKDLLIDLNNHKSAAGCDSVLNVCNLDEAIRVVSDVGSNHSSRDPKKELKTTIFHSPAFMYPHLLPTFLEPIIRNKNRPKSSRPKIKFLPSEDNLIALGLEHFAGCTGAFPAEFIRQYLIRGKTVNEIHRRIMFLSSNMAGINHVKKLRRLKQPVQLPPPSVHPIDFRPPRVKDWALLPKWCYNFPELTSSSFVKIGPKPIDTQTITEHSVIRSSSVISERRYKRRVVKKSLPSSGNLWNRLKTKVSTSTDILLEPPPFVILDSDENSSSPLRTDSNTDIGHSPDLLKKAMTSCGINSFPSPSSSSTPLPSEKPKPSSVKNLSSAFDESELKEPKACEKRQQLNLDSVNSSESLVVENRKNNPCDTPCDHNKDKGMSLHSSHVSNNERPLPLEAPETSNSRDNNELPLPLKAPETSNSRDNNELPLPLEAPETSNSRDNYELPLPLEAPETSNSRDNNELPLPLEAPETSNSRDNNELPLPLEALETSNSRDNNELPLPLEAPETSNSRDNNELPLPLEAPETSNSRDNIEPPLPLGAPETSISRDNNEPADAALSLDNPHSSTQSQMEKWSSDGQGAAGDEIEFSDRNKDDISDISVSDGQGAGDKIEFSDRNKDDISDISVSDGQGAGDEIEFSDRNKDDISDISVSDGQGAGDKIEFSDRNKDDISDISVNAPKQVAENVQHNVIQLTVINKPEFIQTQKVLTTSNVLSDNGKHSGLEKSGRDLCLQEGNLTDHGAKDTNDEHDIPAIKHPDSSDAPSNHVTCSSGHPTVEPEDSVSHNKLVPWISSIISQLDTKDSGSESKKTKTAESVAVAVPDSPRKTPVKVNPPSSHVADPDFSEIKKLEILKSPKSSPVKLIIFQKRSPKRSPSIAPKASCSKSAPYVPLPRCSPKRKELNRQVRTILPKSFNFETKNPSPTKTAALNLKKKATLLCQKSPVKNLSHPINAATNDGDMGMSSNGQSTILTRSQMGISKPHRRYESSHRAVRQVKKMEEDYESAKETESEASEIEESGLSQEEDEDRAMLDDLMAASTTIRFGSKQPTIDEDVKTKAKKRRAQLLSLVEPDMVQNDPKKDDRDTAFAQQYFDKVKETLSSDPERFCKFLNMLKDINEERTYPVELYMDMVSLLSDHKELVEEFAGFLLSFQAWECQCFYSNFQYNQIRRFLRQVEIYCGSATNTHCRVLKALSKWSSICHRGEQEGEQEGGLKHKMMGILKNVPGVMDNLLSYFLDGDVTDADCHSMDFEDICLDDDDQDPVAEGDVFETIVLPDEPEDYNTITCSCQCHSNNPKDEAFLRRSKHCISCSLQVDNGQHVLKMSKNDIRPVSIVYPREELEMKEKLSQAKIEAAQFSLAKAKLQQQQKGKKRKRELDLKGSKPRKIPRAEEHGRQPMSDSQEEILVKSGSEEENKKKLEKKYAKPRWIINDALNCSLQEELDEGSGSEIEILKSKKRKKLELKNPHPRKIRKFSEKNQNQQNSISQEVFSEESECDTKECNKTKDKKLKDSKSRKIRKISQDVLGSESEVNKTKEIEKDEKLELKGSKAKIICKRNINSQDELSEASESEIQMAEAKKSETKGTKSRNFQKHSEKNEKEVISAESDSDKKQTKKTEEKKSKGSKSKKTGKLSQKNDEQPNSNSQEDVTESEYEIYNKTGIGVDKKKLKLDGSKPKTNRKRSEKNYDKLNSNSQEMNTESESEIRKTEQKKISELKGTKPRKIKKNSKQNELQQSSNSQKIIFSESDSDIKLTKTTDDEKPKVPKPKKNRKSSQKRDDPQNSNSQDDVTQTESEINITEVKGIQKLKHKGSKTKTNCKRSEENDNMRHSNSQERMSTDSGSEIRKTKEKKKKSESKVTKDRTIRKDSEKNEHQQKPQEVITAESNSDTGQTKKTEKSKGSNKPKEIGKLTQNNDEQHNSNSQDDVTEPESEINKMGNGDKKKVGQKGLKPKTKSEPSGKNGDQLNSNTQEINSANPISEIENEGSESERIDSQSQDELRVDSVSEIDSTVYIEKNKSKQDVSPESKEQLVKKASTVKKSATSKEEKPETSSNCSYEKEQSKFDVSSKGRIIRKTFKFIDSDEKETVRVHKRESSITTKTVISKPISLDLNMNSGEKEETYTLDKDVCEIKKLPSKSVESSIEENEKALTDNTWQSNTVVISVESTNEANTLSKNNPTIESIDSQSKTVEPIGNKKDGALDKSIDSVPTEIGKSSAIPKSDNNSTTKSLDNKSDKSKPKSIISSGDREEMGLSDKTDNELKQIPACLNEYQNEEASVIGSTNAKGKLKSKTKSIDSRGDQNDDTGESNKSAKGTRCEVKESNQSAIVISPSYDRENRNNKEETTKMLDKPAKNTDRKMISNSDASQSKSVCSTGDKNVSKDGTTCSGEMENTQKVTSSPEMTEIESNPNESVQDVSCSNPTEGFSANITDEEKSETAFEGETTPEAELFDRCILENLSDDGLTYEALKSIQAKFQSKSLKVIEDRGQLLLSLLETMSDDGSTDAEESTRIF